MTKFYWKILLYNKLSGQRNRAEYCGMRASPAVQSIIVGYSLNKRRMGMLKTI